MRERIRIILAALFYYSGLVRFLLWLKERRAGRQIIILNYHRATGGNLDKQMRYLGRYYRVMHLDEGLQELYASRTGGEKRQSGAGGRRDRRLPIVLTFDDAYLDNYTYGFELARELRIPITIFVIPGYIESGAYFWWLAGEYLVEHTKVEKVTIQDRTYNLAQAAERKALIQAIDGYARQAASVAEREAFLNDIQVAMNVPLPRRTGSQDDKPDLPMTWAELRKMEESGWVSYGAHTMHHPVLIAVSNDAELRYEVAESRRMLEERLGHSIRIFAYPIGKVRHIGDRGVKAVKEAGYEWAVSTIEEVGTPSSDPYLIGRLPGDIELHWLVMAAELVGLFGIVSRLRRKV